MPIRVILGVVNDGIQKYKKGDIITGLSHEDESRLVSLGIAELIPEASSPQLAQAPERDDELIKKTEPSAPSAPKEKRKKKTSEAETDIVNVEFNPDELIKE